MKAVILAGGLGIRLKPFTEIIPKPLLPIGEKSVLEIQITRLKKYGFDEIYLATNYKSDYIKNFFGDGSRYGVKLKISKEEKPLGTVGPLSLLKQDLTEPFIVMNGDILTTIDFLKFYEFGISIKADLMVTIKKLIMPFAFGNIFYDGDYVTGIEEKPDIEREILAGLYLMKPTIFDLIPFNNFLDMDKLIKSMLNQNIPVGKYHLREYWLDIGQISDYEKAQDDYKMHFNEELGA
jgi:NDP-sugar pyrophosphorylase family protein